jgi:hypothetical protein
MNTGNTPQSPVLGIPFKSEMDRLKLARNRTPIADQLETRKHRPPVTRRWNGQFIILISEVVAMQSLELSHRKVTRCSTHAT